MNSKIFDGLSRYKFIKFRTRLIVKGYIVKKKEIKYNKIFFSRVVKHIAQSYLLYQIC